MFQLTTVLNGTHRNYSEPKSSDAATVQVAWRMTEICRRLLCICQMAFKKKQLCFAPSFQMTPTEYTQSASSRDEGCAETLRWDFTLQREWFLELTATHMKSTLWSLRVPQWLGTEVEINRSVPSGGVSREEQRSPEQVRWWDCQSFWNNLSLIHTQKH